MNKLYNHLIIMSLFVLGASCVGTDHIDDGGPRSLKDPVLSIDTPQQSVLVGEKVVFSATYLDEDGVLRQKDEEWSSSDESVLAHSSDSTFEALSEGFAFVYAEVNGILDSAVVNVLEDTSGVVSIEISSDVKTVSPGETLQFEARALGNSGQVIAATVEWAVSDESILEIDQNGKVSTLKEGEASVYAMVDGIMSNLCVVTVTRESRKAVFTGNRSYEVSGCGVLKMDNGDLILELSEDFEISSFGAGLVLYLSNQPLNISGGLEVADLTQNGPRTFNVTAVNPDVTLFSFDHIIVHCQPFNIPFGTGELN